ncbi:VOC family protein [Paracoccus zhejiangensis]|uniref:Glyoxalase/bleomycin resistance/extradiol dioxygenase family protein n=1 Tax=Paracoccus zhejiangensis TaxID=1077935 RepID=A0A2H5EXH5_9RHOB|nr:VOC family protein [Paracoccus zhejiangensis]AUH64006.1 glyoxalase/bleomycin resistance/extradiol dioxygenase family protein [Paracoccus zhejiangensis]
MTSFQGNPCWYELTSGDSPAAADFYGKVLGWTAQDAGVPGFDYLLAKSGEDMVAGLANADGNQPPHWLIYFAVDDCDATVQAILKAGGKDFVGPEDIPGTGRFAIVGDPQGGRFGILQPDLGNMTPEQIAKANETGAFDQKKAGHGNWNELMSSDPEAGFAFYSGLFGWQKSTPVDMGEMGTYQLFSHNGADIGGMMGLGNAPFTSWLPYFGANGVTAAMDRISANGGQIIHGPQEVPGGAFIAIAQDPQGAHFAVVGPKEVTP